MRESYRDVTLSFFSGGGVCCLWLVGFIADMVVCFYVVYGWLLNHLLILKADRVDLFI